MTKDNNLDKFDKLVINNYTQTKDKFILTPDKFDKVESRWEPYETYRLRALYMKAREWFIFNRGFEYKPSEEEMNKLINNPDFIKDTL